MINPQLAATGRELPWRVDNINFARIDASLVAGDERLFFLLASASFIESGASLYTRNLIEHFRDDPAASDWLAGRWEPEELQHGRALQRYVQTVWPGFDWHDAYGRFLTDYGALCTPEVLQPIRVLEFARRCVVETGTATYYRMLYEAAPEPVLREVLDHIRRDEVQHFKYFYRFFRSHLAVEGISRRRVAATLVRRALESTQEDGYCAFRHAYQQRYPHRSDVKAAFRAFRNEVHRLAQRHYPHRMAAEMFLSPLGLSPVMRRPATWMLARALRFGL
jgi:hypothetical protein